MFTNVFNFRDLSTADSVRLRPGRIYRSDALSRFDDEDWARFQTLGIRTVVDLRTPQEVVNNGRVRPAPELGYHNLSPMRTIWSEIPYDESAGVVRYLADRYHELTLDGAGELRLALEIVSAADAAPAVVHCAGGKDRTGVLSALILGLLEVPEPAIVADYARTEDTAPLVTAWLARTYGLDPDNVPPPYAQSPAAAMELFLAEFGARHGTFAAYVRSIGVSAQVVESLRATMLAG